LKKRQSTRRSDEVSIEEEGVRKDTQNECLGAAEAEKAIDTQGKTESIDVKRAAKRGLSDTESWRFTTG